MKMSLKQNKLINRIRYRESTVQNKNISVYFYTSLSSNVYFCDLD